MKEANRPAETSATKPRRWRIRYSLRTLLLLTTVLAVWLGWMTHRARQQERAVQHIQRLGGTIAYDYQFDADENFQPDALPPGPRWFRKLVGPHFGTRVVVVELALRKATDKDLEVLKSLRSLRSLSLAGNPAITDAGLKNMEGLTDLASLDLGDTGISDEGLVHLKNLEKLSVLDLVRCRVNGSGLKHLRHLPISMLNLNWTGITDPNLEYVGAMNDLEILTMQDTPITDDGLVQLRGLTKLRELHIHNTAVTDNGLCNLKGLTRLQNLQVHNTKVTQEGLKELERVLTKLPRSTARWPKEPPAVDTTEN